jgi:hypothetical protein
VALSGGKAHENAASGAPSREDIRETAEPTRVGPWRRLGGYIGRDVTLADGRRTTELQHRVVAAEKIGRPLRADEHAHHENEIKTDNAPDNLEVLTKAEHTRHHFGTGRTMVDLVCAGCGSGFRRDIRRRGSKFCGRSCAARSGGKASGVTRSLALAARSALGRGSR